MLYRLISSHFLIFILFFSVPCLCLFFFFLPNILTYFEDLFPITSLYPHLLSGISKGSREPRVMTRQAVAIFAHESPIPLPPARARAGPGGLDVCPMARDRQGCDVVGLQLWPGPAAEPQVKAAPMG